jgi:hypothetical protein
LRDFLQGILLLAQSGLNDPKLRQRMNPEERQAYLEMLRSADIQKLDRGEWKSVRLVLEITPMFLDVARLASAPTPAPTPAPPGVSAKAALPANAKNAKKK